MDEEDGLVMAPHYSQKRAKEIFEQAIDLSSAEGRLGYAKGACAGDAELLARVATLLRAHESDGFLMEVPGGLSAATLDSSPMGEDAETAGATIGRYKLLQKIGEGGCGVVYMAEQEEPVRRRVAVKVIKLGMDTKEVIARFEAERQALAIMDHPNIAKVFDAGSTEKGRPFFVMELVRGIPITRFCDEQNLDMKARLGLFTQVCHAIQHAHQKGIIHRDIKPSNILVTLHDGVPMPKVIDFGIAKATLGRLTDQTLFTAFEQFIGTPAYMSPEQAELSGLDIDTRSDIYSLGVLLYELLTGRPPFDPKTFLLGGLDEIRRIIREVEPPRPSARLTTLTEVDRTSVAKLRATAPAQLSTLLRGDLDWIVIRCLEKDRKRRYETASALVADIERHLRHEPVVARPPSAAYLLRKLVRRHKLAFGAAAGVALALVAGLAVSTWAYLNERAARQFAVQATQGQRAAEAASNSTLSTMAVQWRRRLPRANQGASAEASRGVVLVDLLKESLQGVPARAGQTADGASVAVLNRMTERVAKVATFSTPAATELRQEIGEACLRLGAYARAEEIFRWLLAAQLDAAGPLDPAVAATRIRLAEALRRQGKNAESDGALRAAQNASEIFYVGDSARTLDHARYLLRRHRTTEAESLMRAACEAPFDLVSERWAELESGIAPRHEMLSELAALRFAAGDLIEAGRFARQALISYAESRRWLFSRPVHDFIFNDTCLLGRIALRQGDRKLAGQYLIEAGQIRGTVSDDYFFGPPDAELLVELFSVGERDIVLRFFDELRVFYIDDFSSGRALPISITRAGYEREAVGRDHAATLEKWRGTFMAGKIPEELTSPVPAPSAPIPNNSLSAASTGRTSATSPSIAATWNLRIPLALQLLGWAAAAIIMSRRRQEPHGLGHGAVGWFTAWCVLRIADCGAFLHVAGTDGYRLTLPDVAIPAMSLLSWTVVAEFTRALRGEVVRLRRNLVVRALVWSLATVAVTALVLGISALINGSNSAPDANQLPDRNDVVRVAVRLLGWLMAAPFLIGSLLTGVRTARELLQRAHTATLPRRHVRFVQVTIPLLMINMLGPFWLPAALHDFFSPALGLAVLWLNAALPWLLIVTLPIAAAPSALELKSPAVLAVA
jgi:hypothetical protein